MTCRLPGLDPWVGEWRDTVSEEGKDVYSDLPRVFSSKASGCLSVKERWQGGGRARPGNRLKGAKSLR